MFVTISTFSWITSQETISIKKLIAQKNIIFSNSMVAAVNKVLKYNLLFPHTITNTEELIKLLQKQIETYNALRPHYSLKGCTPEEVHSRIDLTDINYIKSVNLIQKSNKHGVKEVNCTLW